MDVDTKATGHDTQGRRGTSLQTAMDKGLGNIPREPGVPLLVMQAKPATSTKKVQSKMLSVD